MKTREQAEARALELWPKGDEYELSNHINSRKRQAFLQCWEEMQANKQTCGFCVEPATELPNEKHSESLNTKEDEGSELPSEKH